MHGDLKGRGQKEVPCSLSGFVPRRGEGRESVINFLLPEVRRLEIITFCFVSAHHSVLYYWFMSSYSSVRVVCVPTQTHMLSKIQSAHAEYGDVGAADASAKRSSQKRGVRTPPLSLAKSAIAFHLTSEHKYCS